MRRPLEDAWDSQRRDFPYWNRSRENRAAGSGIHSAEHRGKRAVPCRLAEQRPGVRSGGIPSCLAIRNSRNQGRRAVLSSLGIVSPQDRHKLADPNNPGIHSPDDRNKRGIPSNPDFHSPAVGSLDNRSPDTRKQEGRRLGSHNRCPVAVEVYSQHPRISRLPLRSPRRGRLRARHPPPLQSQHPKPLPIGPHQGRVEQDHKGWCRPRGPTLTLKSHRAQFGSLSILRPSTGSNRQRQRIHGTLSLDESARSARAGSYPPLSDQRSTKPWQRPSPSEMPGRCRRLANGDAPCRRSAMREPPSR